MIQFVTITSQGQITIPAKFRRQLGLQKKQKALVSIQGNKIVIEPPVDLLSLYGSLSHLAMKGKSIDEIIKIEEEGAAEAAADDYRRKFLKK